MDRHDPEDLDLTPAEEARREAQRRRQARKVRRAVFTTAVVVLVALLLARPFRNMARNMARSAKPDAEAGAESPDRPPTPGNAAPITDGTAPASDPTSLLNAAEDASAKTPTVALALYRRATAAMPDDPRAWLGQAKCAARAGDGKLAHRSFAMAVELVPEDVAVRVAYAGFAWSQTDFGLAVEQAQVAITLDAASLEARLMVARALLHSQRASEALPHLHKALELAPDNSRAQLLLGQTLLGMNRLEEAQTALLRAAELAPTSARTKLVLAELRRRQGRPAEAAELLAQARTQTEEQDEPPRVGQIAVGSSGGLAAIPRGARLDPTATLAARIQLEQAEVLAATGKQAKAIDSLRELLASHPDLVQARTRLGELLLALGRADEAYIEARKLVQAHPGVPSGHCLLAMIHLAKGLYSEAEKHCRFALAGGVDHPHRIQALKLQALILQYTGRVDEAAAPMESYLALRPNDLDASLRHTAILALAGRDREADEWLAQVDRRFPDSPGPPLARTALCIRRGDFAAAVASDREALRRGANGYGVHNRLAWYLATKLGKPEAALPHAQTAARMKPQSAETQHTLGWCLFLNGKPKESLRFLESAARASPKSPARRYTLAAALAQLGQTDRAKREVGIALQLAEDFEFAEEARELRAKLARR
ncbi:MAG: tetratricopeptide repeat protein [Victivallales bacterium]|nr:tetratricopeptide repeat protein [Victivallales bacterium]